MTQTGEDPAWIAIDASKQGQIRFAMVTPGEERVPDRIRSYDAALFSTFTDGLLRFQRDEGVSLRQRRSVIVVAGATGAENIAISRSRWTISRSGLRAMLEREAIILNDTGARAWACLSGAPVFDMVKGNAYAGLSSRGRHVFLHLEEGLGTAIVDVDDSGGVRVIETEAGHLEPPAGIEPAATIVPVRGEAPSSWEKVLMSDHPQRSTLLGRFVANLILVSGAWNGVVLNGAGVLHLLATAKQRQEFAAAFSDARAFRRLLDMTPISLAEQRDPILHGAAAMIARHAPSPA